MKIKIIFLLLSFVIMIFAFGQKTAIELTFTAENNGQYIPMDSILIENLTQGGDTTLYSPDTIFVLDYITRISNNNVIGKNTFSISQNYPNPFKGKTEFNLYLAEKKNIKITVQDILGRELIQYENVLNQGNHTFTFYAGNESNYLLTVTGKQTRRTLKILNSGNTTTYHEEACKIVYTGYKGNVSGFKSQPALNDFVFDLGDELKYTAFTGAEEEETSDTPFNSQVYIIQFDGWTPCPEMSIVTDFDGNTYNTVQIGDQCWMKENLNVGTMIIGSTHQTDNDTIEKYCYDNDSANCDIYGGLYRWDEMLQFYSYEGRQGICPNGWHIPNNAEWTLLTNFLGYDNVAGGKMKQVGLKYWNSPNAGASNESGFTGLPGGYVYFFGQFHSQGFNAHFWSHTAIGSGSYYAWFRILNFSTPFCNYSMLGLIKIHAKSVRCLKD